MSAVSHSSAASNNQHQSIPIYVWRWPPTPPPLHLTAHSVVPALPASPPWSSGCWCALCLMCEDPHCWADCWIAFEVARGGHYGWKIRNLEGHTLTEPLFNLPVYLDTSQMASWGRLLRHSLETLLLLLASSTTWLKPSCKAHPTERKKRQFGLPINEWDLRHQLQSSGHVRILSPSSGTSTDPERQTHSYDHFTSRSLLYRPLNLFFFAFPKLSPLFFPNVEIVLT